MLNEVQLRGERDRLAAQKSALERTIVSWQSACAKLQADVDEHKRATAALVPQPRSAATLPAQRAYMPPRAPHISIQQAAHGGAVAWVGDTNGWGEYRDPASAHVYYYNALTNESSWTRPPELGPAAHSQPQPSAKPRGARGAGGGGGGGGGGGTPAAKGPPGANLFIARAMRRGDVDQYDSAQLRATFEAYGPVVRAEMSCDKESGANKGFGFVSFADVESADRAISCLQGQVIMGKPLRIEKTKEDGATTGPPGPTAAHAAHAAAAFGIVPPGLMPGMMPQAMGGYGSALLGAAAGWGAHAAGAMPPPAGMYAPGAHVGGAFPPHY
ncbi:hypothetical protein KFE25_010818 [Diacronema lutheri]|uniref:Uncharacterized protein n=1 Tax=Diacronema lutheri TaxID=2081491 RepID=A0A8J6CAS2_DIALT|nr:hypothetical protein KFE25_010818 [Diacronema lutheri]